MNEQETQEVTLDAWEEESAQEISINDLDNAVRKVKEIRDEKDALKKQQDAISDTLEIAEGELLDLLTRANKKSYKLDGVATISLKEKLSVQTPKTPEEKRAFFNWVKETHGEQEADSLMTVNSQTLNSFYNAEMELAATRGEADFSIPGILAPVSRTILSVRKA